MISALFGSNRFYTYPLLLALSFLADAGWWGSYVIGEPLPAADSAAQFSLAGPLIRFTIAVLLQQMFIQFELSSRSSFIAFTYIVLSAWGLWGGLMDFGYQGIFLLFLYYFLAMSKYSLRRDNVFFCGFFLGLLALLNLSSLLILAAVLVILVLFGYNLRHMLLLTVGFLMPAYFYGVIEFLLNGTLTFHQRPLDAIRAFEPVLNYESIFQAAASALLVLFLVASRLAWQRSEMFRLLKKRQVINIIAALSVFLILIAFIPLSNTSHTLAMAALPSAFILGRMLEERFPGWFYVAWLLLMMAPAAVTFYRLMAYGTPISMAF